MRVQDVMTRELHTATTAMPADQAFDTMRARKVHHLVVTDANRIVGVLSDRDAIGTTPGSSSVGELMTTKVVTVEPDTTVRRAANLMRGRSIGCVVVASGKKPVGIVTTADLLELLGRGAERPAPMAGRWTLSHRVPHRKTHRPSGTW